MAIANKPLIDRFWDRGIDRDQKMEMRFEDSVPKGPTQIFVLSPEVALAAEKLARSPSFKFPDLKDMHLPYEHIAVEYPLTPEINELREQSREVGTTRIVRIGAYVREVKASNMFMFQPYWEYHTGQIQYSVFTFCINPGNMPDMGRILVNIKESVEGSVEVGVMPSVALIKGFMKVGQPPEIMNQIMPHPNTQTHIRESAIEIPVLAFAANMLLTCKSGIAKARVDARRPITSGLGERKRKEMSSSAYTLIHLSALESVSLEGELTSKVGMAAHYVRGHFKQRKSGLYWWSPFVRGTGEPRKRDAYIVEE